jgi:hypothetical protein
MGICNRERARQIPIGMFIYREQRRFHRQTATSEEAIVFSLQSGVADWEVTSHACLCIGLLSQPSTPSNHGLSERLSASASQPTSNHHVNITG